TLCHERANSCDDWPRHLSAADFESAPPAPVAAAGHSLGHQASARCLSDFTRQDPIRCEVFLSSDSFNPCVSVDSGVLTHARRLASRQDGTAATAWTKSSKKCETFTNFSVERSAQTMIICR